MVLHANSYVLVTFLVTCISYAGAQNAPFYISLDQLARAHSYTHHNAISVTNDTGAAVDSIRSFVSRRAQLLSNVLFGFNGTEWKFRALRRDGRNLNPLMHYKYVSEANIPFQSQVGSNASSVLSLIKEILAGTPSPQDLYVWVGGAVGYFEVSNLIVYDLQMSCEFVSLVRQNGTIHHVSWFAYLRSPPSPITLEMLGPNLPNYCGGNGAVFKDRKDGAQRMWYALTSQNETKKIQNRIGPIDQSSFNDNIHIKNMSIAQQEEIENIEDISLSESAEFLRIIKQTADEYIDGKTQFDNVSFLLLSTIAIVPSVAMTVAVRQSKIEQCILFLVEAIVVHVLLIILIYIYRDLTGPVAFQVKITAVNAANYAFNSELYLGTQSSATETVVGVDPKRPNFVLATLIITALASAFVDIALSLISCRVIVRKIRNASQKEDENALLQEERHQISNEFPYWEWTRNVT